MAIGAKPLLIELRDNIEWGNSGILTEIPSLDVHKHGYKYDYMKVCPDLPPSDRDDIDGHLEKYQAVRVNEILGLYKNKADLAVCALPHEELPKPSPRLSSSIDEFTRFSKFYQSEIQKADEDKLRSNRDTTPSKDYVRLRNLVEKLWQISVDIFTESVFVFGDKRPEFRAEAAAMVSRLTQPRSVAIVMYAPTAPKAVRETLRKRLERATPAGSEFWREEKWTDDHYDEAVRVLKDILIKYPEATVNQLQQAHDWVKSRQDDNDFLGVGDHPAAEAKLAKDVRRRYGIARSLSLRFGGVRGGSPALFTAALGGGGDLKILLATGGLGGGRLEEGLETLIQDYLRSQLVEDLGRMEPTSLSTDTEVTRTDDQLIKALIRFAVKILKMANNEELLRSGQVTDKSVRTYTLVLQAIGNSILVQADELVRQKEHKFKETDLTALKSELEGIEVALGAEFLMAPGLDDLRRSTYCSADTCVEPLESKRRIITKRQVMDRLIAVLRGELIAATRAQAAETGSQMTKSEGAEIDERSTHGGLEPVVVLPLIPRTTDSLETNTGALDKSESDPAKDDVSVDEDGDRESRPTGPSDLPKSDRVRYLERALAIALEHRSGMVYIRPPSAYLRTSYAATGLQSDPRLSWENMLWAHMKRSIPFIGEKWVNKDDEGRLETLQKIDKQFWQNINSVRLAGAGITNYALVKDDIGNWYAKGFSADPEPIIRGAQSLALFSAGGNLNMNLLRQRNLELKRDKKDGELSEQESDELGNLQSMNRADAAAGGPNRAYRAIFDTAERKFLERTGADFELLKERVANKGLPTKIRDGWLAALPDDGTLPNRANALALVQDNAGQPVPFTLAGREVSQAESELMKPEMACDLDKLAEQRAGCLARAKAQTNSIGRVLDLLINRRAGLLRSLDGVELASDAATKHETAKKALSAKQAAITEAKKKLASRERELELARAKRDSLLVGNAEAPQKGDYETAVSDAEGALNQAREDLTSASATLDTLHNDVSKAAEALAFAKGRVAALKDVVRGAIQETLTAMVEGRRDAIDDFRETIQVTGQAPSG